MAALLRAGCGSRGAKGRIRCDFYEPHGPYQACLRGAASLERFSGARRPGVATRHGERKGGRRSFDEGDRAFLPNSENGSGIGPSAGRSFAAVMSTNSGTNGRCSMTWRCARKRGRSLCSIPPEMKRETRQWSSRRSSLGEGGRRAHSKGRCGDASWLAPP